MSLGAFLERLVGLLDEANVPFMLTGSLVGSYYAAPRATQDIDIVIEAESEAVERLIQGLLAAGWYADREAALEAWQCQGQFNAIDAGTGWKADFIVRRDRSHSREEFRRRERISLLGVEVAVVTLEDLLIAKLEWGRLGDSAMQRRDVVELLERNWSQLDQAYLQRWTAELGLDHEWQLAVSQAGLPDLPGGES